jgi:hypothetical protein
VASRFLRPRVLALTAGVLALAAVPAAVLYARRPALHPSVPFSEFVRQVESGEVGQVVIGERDIRVTLRTGATETTVAPPEFLGSNAAFVTDLMRRQVRVEVTPLPDPAA